MPRKCWQCGGFKALKGELACTCTASADVRPSTLTPGQRRARRVFYLAQAFALLFGSFAAMPPGAMWRMVLAYVLAGAARQCLEDAKAWRRSDREDR
jgi:hypothetical protein